MARFDYLEPHSLDDALEMLAEHGDKADWSRVAPTSWCVGAPACGVRRP